MSTSNIPVVTRSDGKHYIAASFYVNIIFLFIKLRFNGKFSKFYWGDDTYDYRDNRSISFFFNIGCFQINSNSFINKETISLSTKHKYLLSLWSLSFSTSSKLFWQYCSCQLPLLPPFNDRVKPRNILRKLGGNRPKLLFALV